MQRILVIEDHEPNRRTIALSLEWAGYAVRAEADGRAWLAAAEANHFR